MLKKLINFFHNRREKRIREKARIRAIEGQEATAFVNDLYAELDNTRRKMSYLNGDVSRLRRLLAEEESNRMVWQERAYTMSKLLQKEIGENSELRSKLYSIEQEQVDSIKEPIQNRLSTEIPRNEKVDIVHDV